MFNEKGQPAAVLQGKSGDNFLEVYGDLGVIYRYTGDGSQKRTRITVPESDPE